VVNTGLRSCSSTRWSVPRRAAVQALGGWLSDKTAAGKLMMAITAAMMALIYVSLRLMLYGSPQEFAAGQIMLAIPIGMALGLQGAMVVEIFRCAPASRR